MIELIGKIGRREGFGDILAEGSLGAARLIGKGAEGFAMQAKGLELAGYEPRGLKATGFGYATSNIGGSHGNGSLAFQEWGMPVPRAVDRFTEEGKADIVIHNQNNSALEVGIVCAFAFSCGDWFGRLFPRMLAAATGIKEFADWSTSGRQGSGSSTSTGPSTPAMALTAGMTRCPSAFGPSRSIREPPRVRDRW